MSLLFITPEDKFKITVKYIEKEEKIEIIDNDSKKEDPDGTQHITVICRKPDFEMSQLILHSSTIFAENGAPVVDIFRVRKSMLYHLAISWDAEDEGKPIPLTPEKISMMNPVVASALCAEVQKSVGDPVAVLMA